jgi:hypothetical protein
MVRAEEDRVGMGPESGPTNRGQRGKRDVRGAGVGPLTQCPTPAPRDQPSPGRSWMSEVPRGFRTHSPVPCALGTRTPAASIRVPMYWS